MKKNALVIFVFLVSLVSTNMIIGQELSVVSNFSVDNAVNVTIEEARKIALKRVEGKVEDEYTIEDDDEKVIAYAFVIKDKKDKMFEVQVNAKDGKIISVEEQTEEEEDSEDPPQTNK